MQSFYTNEGRYLQISIRYDRKSKLRQTESPDLIKEYLTYPLIYASTRRTVNNTLLTDGLQDINLSAFEQHRVILPRKSKLICLHLVTEKFQCGWVISALGTFQHLRINPSAKLRGKYYTLRQNYLCAPGNSEYSASRDL